MTPLLYARGCLYGVLSWLALALFDDEGALELQTEAARIFGGEEPRV